jgi:hypothetical protein
MVAHERQRCCLFIAAYKSVIRRRFPFSKSNKPQPFTVLIATLVAHGLLIAAYSRIGQSTPALRKTPDPHHA